MRRGFKCKHPLPLLVCNLPSSSVSFHHRIISQVSSLSGMMNKSRHQPGNATTVTRTTHTNLSQWLYSERNLLLLRTLYWQMWKITTSIYFFCFSGWLLANCSALFNRWVDEIHKVFLWLLITVLQQLDHASRSWSWTQADRQIPHKCRRKGTSGEHLITHSSQEGSRVLWDDAQNTVKNQYKPLSTPLGWDGQERTDEWPGEKFVTWQMPFLINNGKEFQEVTIIV